MVGMVPAWLERQIVALEIVGSSPIIHPSASLKKVLAIAGNML